MAKRANNLFTRRRLQNGPRSAIIGLMDDKADNKVIILTGGGSAGHVIPNLTLLPDLLHDGWDVHYIGSRNGVEAALARRDGMAYHAISTGKLRRYFDIKNFTDPFKVIAGIFQSIYLILKLKPAVIFSKGGFVAVPVVLAGRLLGVPSVIHESDRSQGLANKICTPLAKKICFAFKESIDELPPKHRAKAVYTGAPVRDRLGGGDAAAGYGLCGFHDKKPVLLAIGGSQGSASLNRIVRAALPGLLEKWQVAHICGKGNMDESLCGINGYKQFEYVGDALPDLYKICRAAVSRAGSNTIFELLYLKIPSVLIPLPLSISRGDQLLNAADFEAHGYCIKLDEHDIESEEGFENSSHGALIGALDKLDAEHAKFIAAMSGAVRPATKPLLLGTIYAAARPR